MAKLWKDDDLQKFWDDLESHPTNIEKANACWKACGDYFRGDIRSGLYVIRIFRECAISSQYGVVALAKAYRELARRSGEYPRKSSLDEELMIAIREGFQLLKGDDKEEVRWLLSIVE